MTISVETNKTTYVGNGSTTVFASVFKIFDDDDILVEEVNDTTDVVTVKVKTTDYTVGTITSPSSTVNITMLTAPATGVTLVLRRNQPQLQSTDLVENDNLPAQTLENAYDKLAMMVQEHEEVLSRTLRLNPSQSLSTYIPTLGSEGGKLLAVNTAEDGFTFTSAAAASLDINSLTGVTPALADSIPIYQVSSTANKKMTGTAFNAILDHDALLNYVANEHIDWTAATANFSTTGNIAVTGTVDGRDVATDGIKLDTIEASANVTNASRVDAALAVGNGIIARTADDTFAGRTVTGTANEIDVTDGDGVAGNPTLSLPAAMIVPGSLQIPAGTTPTVNAAGEIALDTDGDAGTIAHGILKTYDGTQENFFFGTKGTLPTTDNDVLAYDSGTNSLTWQQPAGAGGISQVADDASPALGGQLDVNGNAIGDGTRELVSFTEDALAVNHINIENAETATNPIISAAGDDTNIDLHLAGKGTGNVVASDGTDRTKLISFEVSGATTAKTATIQSSHTDNRTITLPDATDTLLGKATTDTLTNKTLDAGSAASNVVSNLPYDVAFNAGYTAAYAAEDLVVQTYAELVMSRTGEIIGEAGYLETVATGTACIIDIEKNGTTVYSTKPQFAVSTSTLTAGTLKTDGTEDFVSGDRITFKVTQIGSTIAGARLRITMKCEV